MTLEVRSSKGESSMRAALLATSLVVPLVLGSTEAGAQTANRAASCVLPNIVRGAIQVALNRNLPALNGGSAGSNLKVDAIVIHSVANPNEGQPLDSCPPGVAAPCYTGPIVCTFSGPLPIGTPYVAATVAANDPITGIDLLGSEIQTQIQYRKNTLTGGVIEKLLCLTTDNNNDCFKITPKTP
jgi:hypothetical protein